MTALDAAIKRRKRLLSGESADAIYGDLSDAGLLRQSFLDAGIIADAYIDQLDAKPQSADDDSIEVDDAWIKANASTLFDPKEIEAGILTGRSNRAYLDYFDEEMNTWQVVTLPKGATRGDFKQLVKILRLAEIKRKPAETEPT